MRNLIFFLLLLTALPASSQVVAGNYTPGFYSSVNYVKNPSCILNDANITDASGIVSRTTASPITEGLKASCLIDGTASAQVVKFTMSSFDTDLDGGNCEASFSYRGDASLYKVYVESPVSTKISADVQLTNTGSTTRTERINFPCGVRADAKALVLETTGASPAAIKVGNVYGGKATNVGSTQLVGKLPAYTPTTGGFGTNRSNLYVNMNRLGSRLTGDIALTATAAVSGTITFSLPSGVVIDTSTYRNGGSANVVGKCHARSSGSGADYRGDLIINDSTSFSVRGGDGSSNLWNATTPLTWANNDEFGCSLTGVEIQGWAAQTVVMPDAQGWYIDATIAGANPSLGTSNVSSYTEITNGSLTMTPRTGSAAAGIMCSSTNAAATPTTSTSTCSAGSESLGLNAVIPVSGAYEVCADFSHYMEADQAEGVNTAFQIVQTPTNAQTITTEGGSRKSGRNAPLAIASGTAQAINIPYTVCGIFQLSAGTNGFRLMYEQLVTGTPNGSEILADELSTVGQRNMRFTIKPINSQQQAILANSVSTSATNGLKTESFSFTCSGSSSIAAQLGGTSWISSIGNIAAGVCAVGISAGTFSGSPQCQVTWTGGGSNAVVYSYAETSSGFNVGAVTDTGAAATSFTGKAMCVGPR